MQEKILDNQRHGDLTLWKQNFENYMHFVKIVVKKIPNTPGEGDLTVLGISV